MNMPPTPLYTTQLHHTEHSNLKEGDFLGGGHMCSVGTFHCLLMYSFMMAVVIRLWFTPSSQQCDCHGDQLLG